MKRFLLLVLCSILAFPNVSKAADVGSLIESLLQRFGADKVYSKHCVSDCNTLGYTVKSTDLNGRTDCVACPFELECDTGKTVSTPQWYNCPTYSCADLGLLDEKPEGVNCIEVTSAQKPGLTQACFSCQCADGTLNTMGCEDKLAVLNDSPAKCVALGYRNSVTDCENYLACPSDPNKVHCLADTCPAGQKGCAQLIELPDNATGVTERATCCDGTTKDIITSFKCNSGYNLSSDRTSCEATVCGQDQFVGPDDASKGATYNLEDCSTNMAAGWKKVKVAASGVCYECKCLLKAMGNNPSDEAVAVLKQYPYTQSLDNESLSDVACDGKHYRQCSCPANQEPKLVGTGKPLFILTEESKGYWVWRKPAAADIIAEPKFTECCHSDAGDKHNFASGFTCKEANGWILTEDKTTCEAKPCGFDLYGLEIDGVRYSSLYTSSESCAEAMGSSGWSYAAGKSGGSHCGQCECTTHTGRYIQSDSQNQSLVEYSDPVCDGIHYNTCTLKAGVADDYQKKADFMQANPNIAANSFATVKLCGEEYVLKTGFGCGAGYEPDGTGGCKAKACDATVYKLSESQKAALTQDAEQNDHNIAFDDCQSGETKSYELTSCGSELTNYAVNSNKTGCCQICDTESGWSVALCGADQKEDQDPKTSDCNGRTLCHHCIDLEE